MHTKLLHSFSLALHDSFNFANSRRIWDLILSVPSTPDPASIQLMKDAAMRNEQVKQPLTYRPNTTQLPSALVEKIREWEQ